MKKKHPDFVKWLESQLKAFRARRFEKLDVQALGCELEAGCGRYRMALPASVCVEVQVRR